MSILMKMGIRPGQVSSETVESVWMWEGWSAKTDMVPGPRMRVMAPRRGRAEGAMGRP